MKLLKSCPIFSDLRTDSPEFQVAIVMCRHEGEQWDTKGLHSRHSMVVVPMGTPGVRLVRALKVFGYDDAPHGHAEVELR